MDGITYLRDANNAMIGKTRIRSNGRAELFDRNNAYLGHYDPKTNMTRDHNGALIGKGNLLGALLR